MHMGRQEARKAMSVSKAFKDAVEAAFPPLER